MLYQRLSALNFLLCLFTSTMLMSCTSREPGSGPCELIFDYSIHTIDPEFGISEKEVGQVVDKVISVWAAAIDSLHFSQSYNGRVQIRFAYDERQSASDQALQMEENIRSRQMRIHRLREDYSRQERRFESLAGEHQWHVETLNRRTAEINDWINSKNGQGGFSDSDSNQLSGYREEINRMENREMYLKQGLEQKMADLQRLMEQINREIDISNDLVKRFNEELNSSNHFTGADFHGNNGEGIITVYHFRNQRELELVLAHEIGHALGLQHVENPRSVMYGMIGEQLSLPALRLTREDETEIRSQAGCRSLVR